MLLVASVGRVSNGVPRGLADGYWDKEARKCQGLASYQWEPHRSCSDAVYVPHWLRLGLCGMAIHIALRSRGREVRLWGEGGIGAASLGFQEGKPPSLTEHG